jgi:4-amino-4-deoxy-L-arabinose transferase-like glycosyltransferase
VESLPEARNSLLKKIKEQTWADYIYLFAAALALRLWFNFFTNHVNSYSAADASEYLRYATALSKLNFAAPIFGPEWREFAISGPTFPFFLLLCAQISFTAFDAARSDIFLLGQSVVSALTVVFIAQISKSLWDQKTAYWAGGIAAIYPAFIVNSGRLYSETFATFLEVAATAILVKILVNKNSSPLKLSLLGALLILLQLTRSSMILFSFCALTVVVLESCNGRFSNWRKAFFSSSAVILGMLIVLAPWLIFQKNAFNKMTPIVDRVGHYNLFIGTNTDTQGFLTYPYPDGRGIEEKSFLQLTGEAFKKSPTRFIKLALDKPARLYKFPWNDFRTAIGPLNFQAQVVLHQIILLLALCGLCLAWCRFQDNKNEESFRVLAARLTLLLIIFLNFPYLAFITVPRYNLLAMPAIIILAAAGITSLLFLLKTSPTAKAPKIAAMAAIFLLIYLRDDLRAPFSFGEETATLYIIQGTDHLVRSIVSAAGAITLFAAIFCCINLLSGARKTAKVVTVIVGIGAAVLCAIPQRANGRVGEGIVTLARTGEKLHGQISVPSSLLQSDPESQWFILLDSDQGQLLKNQFALSINGNKLLAPPINSISSLDDWHYLKTNGESQLAYLDCAYIFDCLAKPSTISISELRQWFILPVNNEEIEKAGKLGHVTIDIEQNSNKPSSFFCAAPNKSKEKGDTALIPARTLYSWEKSFYGVENDSGFTDTRLDEIVPARNCKWSISYKGENEVLGRDLNCRLIKVQRTSPPRPTKAVSNSGFGQAGLQLPVDLLESKQILTVSTKFSSNTNKDTPRLIDAESTIPQLFISFIGSDGTKQKLPLPGLIALSSQSGPCSLSFLLDLGSIKGSNYSVNCSYPDNNCQITVTAIAQNCHPLFSPQELF